MTRHRRRSRPRPRSRGSLAILVYTLQSCLPPKRWAAVLLPCAGALLFGLLAARDRRHRPERAFANVAAEGIFGLVLPIAALVIGDAVLGAEMRGRDVPVHVAVARHRPGRSCSAAGWADRSSRS